MNNCPWCNRKLIKDTRGIRCPEGFCNYSIKSIEAGIKNKMDAEEIAELWKNGNRKDMLNEIKDMPPLEVAVMALDMHGFLNPNEIEQMAIFISNQL